MSSNSPLVQPLPAHQTKDQAILNYSLPSGRQVSITQDDSLPDSTGRTVWLGAQVLAVYLYELLKKERPFTDPSGKILRRRRALDLGSGTGLLALSLHHMHNPWDVVATDVPMIAGGLLALNLSSRNSSTTLSHPVKLESRALDWFEDPAEWDWTRSSITSPPNSKNFERNFGDLLSPPFDLVVSSDTLYSPDLIQPLLRVLSAVCSPPLSPKPPLVYIALEARDHDLIQSFLSSAPSWGFRCSMVDNGKLEKLLGEGGLGWTSEDWEGVQIWRLRYGKKIGNRTQYNLL